MNFSPIPIVNILLKTVRIFGGWLGAHYYLDLPKNNNKTDKFRNHTPILVLTFLQCDDKLNVFCKYN